MKLTAVNLFALRDLFGAAVLVPNVLPRTAVPHVRRCIALGLVVVERDGLRLTEAGKAAISPEADAERLAASTAARQAKANRRAR